MLTNLSNLTASAISIHQIESSLATATPTDLETAQPSTQLLPLPASPHQGFFEFMIAKGIFAADATFISKPTVISCLNMPPPSPQLKKIVSASKSCVISGNKGLQEQGIEDRKQCYHPVWSASGGNDARSTNSPPFPIAVFRLNFFAYKL
jgi:hypothetical protein